MSDWDRREFLASVTAGVVAGSAAARAGHSSPVAASEGQTSNPQAYQSPGLRPLPLGAIRPAGWLRRQLRIQADGLTGHLDGFWPDVADSQWFGGKAEGWERAPYWLDGAIPLAWALDDGPMKTRLARYVETIVANQRPDGWFAVYPVDAVTKRYDLWAILLANKALAQYHDATGDPRVLDAITKSLRALAAGLDRTPLYGWGKFRWFEGLVPVFHVYDRTHEPWLLELARKLRAQGVDFERLFATDDLALPTPRRGLWKWTKHVVNTAMAAKAPALIARLDRTPSCAAFAKEMIARLDRDHGQVTGMFSGDECLAGRNPLQGTELCSVVEFMYSLEHLVQAFGDQPAFGGTFFADRLERVAFNALPATFTPDMWAHQYDQQVNQVQCTINPDHGWTTNGPDSNIYGLEPNFGCCTSNMHQGWPKFTTHLWMKAAGGELVAAAWAPCRIETEVGRVPVAVDVETDYPFRESVALRVTVPHDVKMALRLRVPGWADGASLQVGAGQTVAMRPGTFHRLERVWARGTTQLVLRFPMRARVTTRYNGAVAVERGPLVYALRIGETWTRVNADKPNHELPHGDFEVRPATPWNYGLVIDESQRDAGLRFEERPVGDQPFSPDGAGVVATALARKIPSWKLVRGWAGEVSPPDVAWSDPSRHTTDEPVERVSLVPYGCTNIRVTEFPRVPPASTGAPGA
jgi:uncharacterized protein